MTIGNRPPTVRADGRGPSDLRPVSFTLGVQKWAEGSCRIRVGDTEVLCAATIVDRVPPHLRGKGTGWVTAEYSMLPRATAERTDRESVKGRIGGRTHEIQRLIGRSLRGVVDLARLGERTITVDCDVLQADGGTRTASITGGYVALAAALITYGMERHLVGQGRGGLGRASSTACRYLDLDYSEDSRADVDFNVVGTDAGAYVELQGTAEGKPFDRAADERPARPGRRRARPAVRGAGRRSWRPSGGDRPAPPRRDPLGPQAARAARAARARARPSSSRSTTSASTGDPVEDGATFETNAAIKARFGLRASGLPTLADDSGLEVDALGGGPGVRTRRYAGEDATDDGEQREAARRRWRGLPPERRGARYVCVLALALPGDAGPRGGVRLDHRPRDLSRADRDGAARDRRVRLRPDLRAGLGAAGRPDARAVDAGREARDLASRPGRPADGAAARRARVRDADAPDLRVLRREPGPRSGLRRARRRRSVPGSPSAGSASSTAAAGSG